jgi:hypothetical protein
MTLTEEDLRRLSEKDEWVGEVTAHDRLHFTGKDGFPLLLSVPTRYFFPKG